MYHLGCCVSDTGIEQKLKAAESLCRRHGLRLTVQRRAILRAALQRTDHPSADEVFEQLRGDLPGLSRTTVYRVLDTLVRVGVIRPLHHTGMPARFDRTTRRHHHLTCVRCHKIVDIDASELDALPHPEQIPEGFKIEDYSVQFFGLCGDCREAEGR